MKTHRWKDIRRKASPDKEEASRQWVANELLLMSLRSVRELAGKTQEEVAEITEIAQGELSKIERREDHLVSTVRRYIEALGGELHVVASFDDKSVRLKGI